MRMIVEDSFLFGVVMVKSSSAFRMQQEEIIGDESMNRLPERTSSKTLEIL